MKSYVCAGEQMVVFLKVKVQERAVCKMRPDHAVAGNVDNEEPLKFYTGD